MLRVRAPRVCRCHAPPGPGGYGGEPDTLRGHSCRTSEGPGVARGSRRTLQALARERVLHRIVSSRARLRRRLRLTFRLRVYVEISLHPAEYERAVVDGPPQIGCGPAAQVAPPLCRVLEAHAEYPVDFVS